MTNKVFLFFSFLILGRLLPAQVSDVINVKQRILQRKPDEMKEQVDSFHSLHLVIGGNVYQTEKHIKYAYDAKKGAYDFKSELRFIQPILNLGDVTIVNLKTSFGNDPNNMFSAPDEFALALKYAGVSAVMHASLYTANVNRQVLKRTRELLNGFDMNHTGAYSDGIEKLGNYPLVINKKGFKIAVLDYSTLPSRPAISRDFVINELDKPTIERDMHMARAVKPDFIIVYFNWGDDYQGVPTSAQQDLARFVFEKGANLVIGSCPNAPMRLDYMDYFYGGKQQQGIVAYSLGNIISSNEEVKNRNGYLIDMEIKKNGYTDETKIDDWGVIPVYTYYDTTTHPGKTSVYALPSWAVESGDVFPDIPYIEQRRIVNGAYEVRKMVGSNGDEIQYNMSERVVNNVEEAIHITNAPLNNKYSPTRESEIKPSSPPALPVVTEGSLDPPSLAAIFEQSNINEPVIKAGKGNEETTRPDRVFASLKRPAGDGNEDYNPVLPSAQSDVDVRKAAIGVEKGKQDKKAAQTAAAETASPTPGADTAASALFSAKNVAAQAQSNPDVAAKSGTTKQGSGKDTVAAASKMVATKDVAPSQPPTPTAAADTKARKNATGIAIDAGETGKVTSSDLDNSGGMKTVSGKQLRAVIDTFYRIQFYALKRYIPLDTNYYTHLKGYEVESDNGIYRYVLGKFPTYEDCYKYWKSQILPRYKQSFIVKYIRGKRVLK